MSDYIVRAYAEGGMVRAFAATTEELTEEARRIHNTSPIVTAALGRLMTAGLMMGAMMKDKKDLLTIKVDGDGPMRGLLVTANNAGEVKGYPFEPVVILPANELGKLDVAGAVGKGSLTVISDLGLKEPYVGQVELVSGEIAEDLAYYYASREQVRCGTRCADESGQHRALCGRFYRAAHAELSRGSNHGAREQIEDGRLGHQLLKGRKDPRRYSRVDF